MDLHKAVEGGVPSTRGDKVSPIRKPEESKEREQNKKVEISEDHPREEERDSLELNSAKDGDQPQVEGASAHHVGYEVSDEEVITVIKDSEGHEERQIPSEEEIKRRQAIKEAKEAEKKDHLDFEA